MGAGITRLFDAMAGSYDELEPWYTHLYRTVHALLREHLAPRGRGPLRALDAGCGTGFQATLLADLGYATHGVDLSAGLLAVARRRLAGAALVRGTLEALPYRDASFDAATCCGSTLSLVDDPARALAELARVLRPGGRLLVECEHRWSLDLGWALLSSVTGDALGYGQTPADAWRALGASPGAAVRVRYPMPVPEDGRAALDLTLFTGSELRRLLTRAGLIPVRTWGIHSVTNVIPSTVLHRPRPGRALGALFRGLCALDDVLGRRAPGRALANSLVVLADRHDPPARPPPSLTRAPASGGSVMSGPLGRAAPR